MDVMLQKINCYYQKQCLFEALDLTLHSGTCTCLLGASGVGKSSLLHLLAADAFHAEVRCDGTIITSDQKPLMGRVMLMTQQDGLLPWLNLLENVLIGYRLRNTCAAEIKERAIALLRQVGFTIPDFSKYPKQLSGGMKQRAALIRTVLEDKPLWLLDEPFASVDAITRYQLHDLLITLWRKKTVLLVTHDPLEALRLADAIYVLHGTPARLSMIAMPKSLAPRSLTPEVINAQQDILTLLQGGVCA